MRGEKENGDKEIERNIMVINLSENENTHDGLIKISEKGLRKGQIKTSREM